MFITFYDKDFNALANNSSLIIESYKLIRRAYDLNEFNCICEPVSLNIEPMFATIKTNDGARYYDMLRPIVTKGKDGKSSVEARDLMGVFNTECLIDFTGFNGTTVKSYLEFLFNSWLTWDKSGFNSVTLNLDLVTTTDKLYHPTEKAAYNVKDLLVKTLSYYGLYLDSQIDMRSRALIFTIRPNNQNTLSVRLEDFGIIDFAKYEPAINTAIVTSDRAGFVPHKWYLLKSGEITTNSALRDVFPTRGKVFHVESADKGDAEHAQMINEADFEAVSLLAENRYQETIELDTVYDERLKYRFVGGQRYDVGFETSFAIYYQGKHYKTLPLGEIEDTGKDNKLLRIGWKISDLIQIISRREHG